MRSIEVKPYEISLWQDDNVYVIRTGTGSGATYTEVVGAPPVLSDNQIITNNYNRETKIAVIGTDTMDTPIRAFSPVFQQKVNGENTLTFQMFYHYYDEQSNQLELNPFNSLLTNERKVKLKYDGNWYDLIIKSVQENKDTHIFTYVCKDQYITELSKNGYELTFDTELENNMGTIIELGKQIVEGTDWEIDEANSDKVAAVNQEVLFTYELPSAVIGTVMRDFTYKNSTWTKGDTFVLPANSIIFISYSSYMYQDSSMQFFCPSVSSDGRHFICDDDGVILNAPNLSSSWPIGGVPTGLKVTSTYRGNVLTTIRPTVYCDLIDKFCYKYKNNNQDYYAWTESEYAAVTSIQQILTNNTNFASTEGWTSDGNSVITLSSNVRSSTTYNCLRINFNNSKILNSGFNDNRALFSENGIIAGEKYIFGFKPFDQLNINDISDVKLVYQKGTESPLQMMSCEVFHISDSRLNGWQLFRLTFSRSLSYEELLEGYLTLQIFSSNSDYVLEDSKLFKELYGEDSKLIIPSLETDTQSIIRTKYYFFKKSDLDSITDKDQLKYTLVCYENEIPNDYQVQENTTHEKVTSINGQKSNRFNLIQTLCETFEVWARFSIRHDSNGQIYHQYVRTSDTVTQADKSYYTRRSGASSSSNLDTDYEFSDFSSSAYERKVYKLITFKEYVGAENYAGFKYGINLKSIQRTLDSDQIITKLIVEPNSNEFADNGSCSIQYSTINSTGENTIYNWDYFINHKLLDKDALYYDLYDTNGLGFFVNLCNWNKEVYPTIVTAANIGITLSKLYSKQAVYETLVQEATSLRDQYTYNKNNAKALVNNQSQSLTPTDSNQTVKDWQHEIDLLNINIARYTEELVNLNQLISNYETEYNGLQVILDNNATRKNALYSKFYKKYSRFIQEGSWISEDYYDSDLYYTDATKVLYNSAFPQVNYTINVFELSQVDGFEPYQFKIGDRTYIEDTEFFGYVPNSGGRPYQEEIVISEVSYNLDDPSQNQIKVQNYKTQFEDLFQRITAATQSLQFYEGKYQRSADAIEDNGTISGSVLEKTLGYNAVLADAMQREIEAGGQYIRMQSVTQPNRFLQISALGIQLSKNGGITWDTAISGDGINADVGVYGSLHTNRLSIYGGDSETFMWDAYGLNAYSWDPNSSNIYYNKFVRLDKYGLYGYMGNTASEYHPNSVNDVVRDAVFSLTWNGLNINAAPGSATNYVKISTNSNEIVSGLKKVIWAGDSDGDNFIVFEDGSILANNGTFIGVIKAQDLLLPGSTAGTYQSILENNKIKGDYINAKGIKVYNQDPNHPFFEVTDSQVIITNGTISFSAVENLTSTIGRIDNTITANATTAHNEAVAAEAAASQLVYDLKHGRLHDTDSTFIDQNSVNAPIIHGGQVIGSQLIAADSNTPSYALITGNSFKLYENTESVDGKIELKIVSYTDSLDRTFYYPSIYLGIGTGNQDKNNRGQIKKLRDGLWIGNNVGDNIIDVQGLRGVSGANGMFINFNYGEMIEFFGNTEGAIARFG